MFKKKYILTIIGILLPTLILFFFPATRLGNNINLWWDDFLYYLRGEKSSPKEIIVVAIDEPSFQEIGLQWPWPRSLHAQLIDRLKKNGAKSIAFDILFVEHSKYPGDDDIFAASIKNAGNVVLGANITQIKRNNYTQMMLVKPLEKLSKYAATIALVNFAPDIDGIIRHGRFLINNTPTLSYAAVSVALKENFPKQNHDINEPFLIDFRGPSGNIKTVSYYQALEPDKYLPENIFRDKIVFVGLASDAAVEVSKGAIDAFPTPFFRLSRKAMFGVEIHANTAFTILEGTPLTEYNTYLIFFIFLFLSLITMKFKNNPQILSIYTLASTVLSTIISVMLFINNKIMISLGVPLTAVITSSSYWGITGFISTYKDKKMIKDAFDKYVNPSVVEEVLKKPDLLKLGGEKRVLTVLFSDIRGFTTLSEKLEPEKLVYLLNEYLSKMTDKVFINDGLLDKFIGDAVMAIFGAPLPNEKHAELACKTAVEMINALDEVGKIWIANNMPAPKIGIGINTGNMVVGNMGSFDRFDYTVIGDEVNLASRLEGLTKEYGVEIIVSESTYNRAKDKFLFRELDLVKVKGKLKPVKIFELIPNDFNEKIIKKFLEGLFLYREGNWSEAKKIFMDIIKEKEDDNPSKLFLSRCEILLNSKLDEKWERVWTMKTK